MTQIAVINGSSLPDPDVAFMAAACNVQMMEAAQAWGLTPWPVVFYSKADGLPEANCKIMAIVDSLDVQGALGYHTDELGAIYGRVLAQGEDICATLSHECLEMLVDPDVTGWKWMNDLRQIALEVADPVEADTYPINATIDGETRTMAVSNYVFPSFFDPLGQAPFDRLGKLAAPFTMTPGGYEVVRDGDGAEFDIFAMTRPGDADARHRLAGKMMKRGSRTLRRLRG